MRNEFVANSMRRERFITIMRFLHWGDNSKPSTNDRVWKLLPVIDMLQAKFLEHFVPTEHLNYDESMIKYFGRCGLKQLIKGKPIRYGYKVWCLNAENGYLVSFEIYQGEGPEPNEEYNKLFGKCTAPLVKMLDKLPEKDLSYQIFTDNLFTSVNLLKSLRMRGYGATGTIRENRMPKECPLSTKEEMKKKPRGSFESTISKDDGIIFVRWNDNESSRYQLLLVIASCKKKNTLTCHGFIWLVCTISTWAARTEWTKTTKTLHETVSASREKNGIGPFGLG